MIRLQELEVRRLTIELSKSYQRAAQAKEVKSSQKSEQDDEEKALLE